METYRGYEIRKNAVNYYEAYAPENIDETYLWAQTIEEIKNEVDIDLT